MIKVYKAESGQFVLVHAPTQTFIMDDDLERAYGKLQNHIEAHYPDQSGEILDPMEKSKSSKDFNVRIAHLLLLVFLALLPFVWLLLMHRSLAALMTDWPIRTGEGNVVSEDDFQTLRRDVDFLRLEQNRLIEVLHQISEQIVRSRVPASAEPAPTTVPRDPPPDSTVTGLGSPADSRDRED